MSYFKDVKVGDKVKCLARGEGEVFKLEYGDYPIVIKFDNYVNDYNLEGRTYIFSPLQTLYYADHDVQIVDRGRPEKEYQVLYKDFRDIYRVTCTTWSGEEDFYDNAFEAEESTFIKLLKDEDLK